MSRDLTDREVKLISQGSVGGVDALLLAIGDHDLGEYAADLLEHLETGYQEVWDKEYKQPYMGGVTVRVGWRVIRMENDYTRIQWRNYDGHITLDEIVPTAAPPAGVVDQVEFDMAEPW